MIQGPKQVQCITIRFHPSVPEPRVSRMWNTPSVYYFSNVKTNNDISFPYTKTFSFIVPLVWIKLYNSVRND